MGPHSPHLCHPPLHVPPGIRPHAGSLHSLGGDRGRARLLPDRRGAHGRVHHNLRDRRRPAVRGAAGPYETVPAARSRFLHGRRCRPRPAGCPHAAERRRLAAPARMCPLRLLPARPPPHVHRVWRRALLPRHGERGRGHPALRRQPVGTLLLFHPPAPPPRRPVRVPRGHSPLPGLRQRPLVLPLCGNRRLGQFLADPRPVPSPRI
mmetsp:Transcript_9860/g.27698  ORF Transcript_9860/g.27698 Transcript_9860/m.27698 type:complete len:207 (+) Transcript_9860:728-1348(+)